MRLGAWFLCLLSVCPSLTWVGGQGPHHRWAGCRRLDGTGREGTEGDRTSWLCLPRQWRLSAARPLCLLSAGGEAGGHAIVSARCGDNWGVAFPGAPWGAQGWPDLPPHTLGGAWEGGEPGWAGAAGRAMQAGVQHGGLCHCPCSSSAAAGVPVLGAPVRAPVQSLPGVLGLASGLRVAARQGQVPVTAADHCPGRALPCLVRAASLCGRVAVADGLGAAVGHLLPHAPQPCRTPGARPVAPSSRCAWR